MLETGSEMALTLFLKEYGIEGKPELELMKLLSRVRPSSLFGYNGYS